MVGRRSEKVCDMCVLLDECAVVCFNGGLACSADRPHPSVKDVRAR